MDENKRYHIYLNISAGALIKFSMIWVQQLVEGGAYLKSNINFSQPNSKGRMGNMWKSLYTSLRVVTRI